MANSSKKKTWVSELIGNDYKKWNGRIILLACGTGRGKTTFALGTYCKFLLAEGKSVIYLCNRTTLKEQIRYDINRYGIKDITCISYQKFTQMLIIGNVIPEFDVYICDEAHYFLSDSEFNLYTDIIYEYLINRSHDKTLLFMTATYRNIFNKIERDIKDQSRQEAIKYFLPTDYGYVDKICWFRNGDLYGIIDDLLKNTDDKIIYFCNSITKMRKLYNHYSPTKGHNCDEDENVIHETKIQYMNFYCSDTSDNKGVNFVKKYCSKDIIYRNKNTGGYSFNNRLLITTKVLDNGVDFKDRKVKHIICDIFDLESAIQCLGRKRIIDENDTCTFYVRDYQSYELNLFYKKVVEQLEPVLLLKDNRAEWINRYGKDREYKDYTIFFDFDYTHDWKINELRFEKLLSDEAIILDMKEKRTSYREEILKYLDETVADKSIDMSDVTQERVQDIIEIYLKNNVNRKLSKEEQGQFVNICDLKDRFNRQQTSIGQIKKYLEVNYGFTVVSKQYKEKKRYVRYWIIKRIDDTKNQMLIRPL